MLQRREALPWQPTVGCKCCSGDVMGARAGQWVLFWIGGTRVSPVPFPPVLLPSPFHGLRRDVQLAVVGKLALHVATAWEPLVCPYRSCILNFTPFPLSPAFR